MGSVELPDSPTNPSISAKVGAVVVPQAARPDGAVVEYGPLKTGQSYRRVPLTNATANLCGSTSRNTRVGKSPARISSPEWLTTPRLTGVQATPTAPGAASNDVGEATRSASAKDRVRRQAATAAELTVEDAEKRSVLDWARPLPHDVLPGRLPTARVARCFVSGTGSSGRW